jgi:hypothetical protein
VTRYARWFSALLLLGTAACGGRTSGAPVISSGTSSRSVAVAVSGAGASGAGASGAIATSGTVTVVGSGAVASGTVVGMSGTVTSSGSMTTGGMHPVMPSTGCGPTSKWTGALGKWVSQPDGCGPGSNNQGTSACQAIPPGSTVPAVAARGTPEYRGWWVFVPETYDSTKPYKVIYSGAGCGDGNYFNAGEDGFSYYNVDDGQAILVGLDYDTYSDVLSCYDDRDPLSNDFLFFPWLQNEIESSFCVDTNHEFFSGYSAGGWVMQQFNCAFPDKLRGSVAVTGCEPGAAGYPGAQYSPCVDKPTAAFFVKDFEDTADTYACILPACARVLEQNGCVTAAGTPYTACNPLDTSTTTPYPVPATISAPPQTDCVTFNGCPADYPVVFCVDHNQDQTDSSRWAVPLFWDWMSNKLAD